MEQNSNFALIGDIIDAGAVVSLRGAVSPNAANRFSLSVSCKEGESTTTAEAEIFVTSDVNVTFDVTTTPSPAVVNQNLTASITLHNGGGSSAMAVNCRLVVPNGQSITVSCFEGPTHTSNLPSCALPSLRAGETKAITMQFSPFKEDVNVTLACTADNVPEAFGHNFTIYSKADAQVTIDPVTTQDKVSAGSNFYVNTTIRNLGRATADKLFCVFGIEAPSVFVSGNNSCVPTIDKKSNATTELRCEIGDLPPAGSEAFSFVFHTDSGLEEGNPLKFNWFCTAEGLPTNTTQSVEFTITRENKLEIMPPKSNSLAGGRDAALFKINNPGPSDVVNGQCIVTLSKGFTFYQFSQSVDFVCNKSTDATQLDCDIKRLRPGHPQDMDLSVIVPKEANANETLVVSTFCRPSTSAAFNNVTFPFVVGSASTPKPPLPPTPVAQDNTMILLVTVIMAIGLLIVIVIWWRRKQDRAGWDATGPAPRSPSLNRFSDMELASRGDD